MFVWRYILVVRCFVPGGASIMVRYIPILHGNDVTFLKPAWNHKEAIDPYLLDFDKIKASVWFQAVSGYYLDLDS